MITVESADSALKNIYLDTVINEINKKTNPFLTMIDKNKRTVMGKEAKATVRYGDTGNVAAGTESGDLPTADNEKYAEIVSPLKNLYGTFQITDKALKAAQNNPGAFASLLSGEMQNLIAMAQNNLNRMVYGNGMPCIGYSLEVDTSVKAVKVPMRFINNFTAGQKVWMFDANNKCLGSQIPVQVVDKAAGIFTYTGGITVSKCDRVYIYSNPVDSGIEMNGIDSIFMQDKIYNLSVADHSGIQPFIFAQGDKGTAVRALDEDELYAFFDAYEDYCQCNPADILITHPSVRKALFETLKEQRMNMDLTEFEGGFRGFSFNGIPMYSDIKCKAGTLYALESSSWNMHQLCDWTWFTNDSGMILHQVSGKPVYTATLVKYADLICDKPFLQGKATNYAANKFVN